MNLLTKPQLETSIKINVILLCVFASVFALISLIGFLQDIFAMFGASLMVTYLLLGAVNTVEGGIKKLTHRSVFPFLRQDNPLPEEKAPVWMKVLKHIPLFNPRLLATLLVFAGFLMIIILAGIRVMPPLSEQVRGFAQDLPEYLSQLDDQVNQMTRHLAPQIMQEAQQASAETFKRITLPDLPVEVAPVPQEPSQASSEPKPSPTPGEKSDKPTSKRLSKQAMSQLVSNVQQDVPKALHNLLEVATTTVEGILYTVATLVITFFLLLDGRRLKRGFVELLPLSFQNTASRFLVSTHTILYTFIKGQVVLGFLAGAYMYFVFSLFEVKYAGFLGLFFGLASILPVVGPWVGLLPGVLVVLFSTNRLDAATILMAAGSFYVLKEYWISRKLVGTVLEIHPVMVILTFWVCVKVGGWQGVFLAFPLASLICVAIQFCQGSSGSIQAAIPDSE
jgi:predicted PurR-regulated permease PerM